MRCKRNATVLDVQGAQQLPLHDLSFHWACPRSHQHAKFFSVGLADLEVCEFQHAGRLGAVLVHVQAVEQGGLVTQLRVLSLQPYIALLEHAQLPLLARHVILHLAHGRRSSQGWLKEGED